MRVNYFTDLTVPPQDNLEASCNCWSKSLLFVASVWEYGNMIFVEIKIYIAVLGEIKFQPLLLV